MKDGSAVVNLLFSNTSKSNSIAVALHGEENVFRELAPFSSLIGADGSRWSGDKLTGIRGIVANPRSLTLLTPGKDLKASISFRTGDSVSDSLTAMRLNADVVVSFNYKENQYDNYVLVYQQLPPYCKVVPVIIDIPLRRK
jgi:hypothetical protein